MATPELWVRDLVAVLDAAESTKPVVFGAHEGGPISLLYAASLPHRTEALVLANTGPRLLRADDYPHGFAPESWTPTIDGIVSLWESGEGAHDHVAATRHDPWWRQWYGRSRRHQATPGNGLALMKMIGQLDVRSIVPSVHAPTLLLHRRDNAWWPVGGARWLEATLPNARLVELEGRDNLWWSGDADRIVDEIEGFLLGDRSSAPSERELVTIAFTDIVDSTEIAARLGDTEWRRLLDGHDSVTQAEATRHGGTLVKSLGDGFLLQFEGPAAAIAAADEIHDAVGRLGLTLRIAIHTGEAERRGSDVNGIAVHLASRVLDVAGAGETLVTGVVRGLVAGSSLRFEDRGRHSFRGIPDEWEVHAVVE